MRIAAVLGDRTEQMSRHYSHTADARRRIRAGVTRLERTREKIGKHRR